MFDKKAKSKGESKSTVSPINRFSMSAFDELALLAQNKPIEFEELRTKLCHELIQSAPKRMRKRLLGLQFTIDMQRRKTHTALSSCLNLSRMMHDSLLDLQEALSNHQNYSHASQCESAKIIPLFQNT